MKKYNVKDVSGTCVVEINADQSLTPDEKEQKFVELAGRKGDEVKVINTDYLQKSFLLAIEMRVLKEQMKTETGFIGDVYIEGTTTMFLNMSCEVSSRIWICRNI